jgi:hypothetical protein
MPTRQALRIKNGITRFMLALFPQFADGINSSLAFLRPEPRAAGRFTFRRGCATRSRERPIMSMDAVRIAFMPSQPGVSTRPRFPAASIVLRIVFPLLAIVPAPAAFLSPAQELAF